MSIDLTLQYLLESMEEGIQEMYAVLRDGALNTNKVQALARVAHKLKGEAEVVGLRSLSRIIIELEDDLERLQDMKRLDKSHLENVGLCLLKIELACENIVDHSYSTEHATAEEADYEMLQVANAEPNFEVQYEPHMNLDDFKLNIEPTPRRPAKVVNKQQAEKLPQFPSRELEYVARKQTVQVTASRQSEPVTRRQFEQVTRRQSEEVTRRPSELVAHRQTEQITHRQSDQISRRQSELVSRTTYSEPENIVRREAEYKIRRDAETISHQLVPENRENRSSSDAEFLLHTTDAVPEPGLGTILHILCQNVAQSCGKQVELDMDLFDMDDVPQSVRTKVQDILIQLIRNAIAHGIEMPEQRKSMGKRSVGKVTVATQHTGTDVFIRVHDNGSGIDLEKIRKRLIVKLDFEVMATAQMSDEELMETIFIPGFSTLSEQQANAGRGVGLDLVQAHAKTLGGDVYVSHVKNQYAQFVVRLPTVQTDSKGTSSKVTTLIPRNNPKTKTRKADVIPILTDIANTSLNLS